MRIKDESFEWTLHEIKCEHEANAQDKVNPLAAKYFTEVSKVDVHWWKEWIRKPHSSSEINVSYHQLTLFAAVISRYERALCANVAKSLGGDKGEGIGELIEGYTYYDWWPSDFPIDPD
jgi:hypothetical protein